MNARQRTPAGHHAGALRRRGRSVCHRNQFNIDDQIGFGGNRWMRGVARGNLSRTQPQCPGNKEAALAPGLHPLKSHVPTGQRTPRSHDRRSRLRIAEFGLSVGIQNRLPILVKDRRAVVVGGVDLVAIDRRP
jgi:hypothetical protein